MTYDYTVRLISSDIPYFKEAVVPNPDGSFDIYINARLSSNQQEQAFLHAVRHIEGHDFEKSDVQIIEQQAHC